MEMNDQLNVTAALPPEKEPMLPFAGWSAVLFWTFGEDKNILLLPGI
jgi:hypothetical protein